MLLAVSVSGYYYVENIKQDNKQLKKTLHIKTEEFDKELLKFQDALVEIR